MTGSRLVHLGCNATAEGLDEEPPDPDMWGNMRYLIECSACGERGVVVRGPHGGSLAPQGFRFDRDLDWVVTLA